MSVKTEQTDDLIARITTSLEEIAGTKLGERVFANVNECLREFVEEARSASRLPRRERRAYQVKEEEERRDDRNVVDLSLLLAPKLRRNEHTSQTNIVNRDRVR